MAPGFTCRSDERKLSLEGDNGFLPVMKLAWRNEPASILD
jgi:hypothetical protein